MARPDRVNPFFAVDDDHRVAQDPTEVVGPEGSSPDPGACQEAPGVLSGGPEMCRFNVEDHLQDALTLEPTVIGIDPEDGLPVPLDRNDPAEVPVQTIENFLCMADERDYVETFADEYGMGEYQPPEMRQGLAFGASRLRWNALGTDQKLLIVTRDRYDERGAEVPRLSWPKDKIRSLFGQTYVELESEPFLLELFRYLELQARAGNQKRHGPAVRDLTPDEVLGAVRVYLASGGRVLLPVRPRRRQCEHYKSSLFGVSESPGRKIKYPWCTAIRSVGGAYMSLQGEAIFACEHRYPSDPETTERLLLGPEREKVLRPPVRLPFFERFTKTPEEKKAEAENAARAAAAGTAATLFGPESKLERVEGEEPSGHAAAEGDEGKRT